MKPGLLGYTFLNTYASLPDQEGRDAFARHVIRFLVDGTVPPASEVPPMLWNAIVRELSGKRVVSPEELHEIRSRSGRAGAAAKWGDGKISDSPTKTTRQSGENGKNGKMAKMANLPYNKERKKTDEPMSDEPLPSKRVKKPMSDDPMSHAPASAPASGEPDPPPVPSAIGPSDHRSSVFIHPSSFGDPVDYALAVSREPVTKYARRCYGAYLRDLGKEAFVDTVERFAAEVRAGEIPHSIPAALNARLKAALEIRQSFAAASSGT